MNPEILAVTQARRKASRALDWACAAMIVVWGVTLALPGDTLASSLAYQRILARLPEEGWAAVLIVIGMIRFAALIINGHMPKGSPIVRGFAAFLGVVVWAQFFVGFLDASIRMGVASAGVGIHLVMLCADIFSTGRAAADAIRARQRHAVIHRG